MEQDRVFFQEQYSATSLCLFCPWREFLAGEPNRDSADQVLVRLKLHLQLRTKSLEEGVRAWRRIAEFLVEKDHRTNNDGRRAAEEPELCDRQESALENFSGPLLQLGMDLDEKERPFI